ERDAMPRRVREYIFIGGRRQVVNAAIPMNGADRGLPARLPKNGLVEKLNTPPSAPTLRYPPPNATRPSMGRFRRDAPMEPRNGASKANTPPSEATSQ